MTDVLPASESATWPDRYAHLDRVLTRSGPFTDPDSFSPGAEVQSFLRDKCKILVIGEHSPSCAALLAARA